ncbi:MAG: NAD(P)H-dependent oxidoreductase [Pseudomonadota bacterium]
MQALVVYCHPKPESFTAAIRDRVVAGLREGGAEVEVIDLYAEGFAPCLTQAEMETYEVHPANVAPVRRHVEAVRAADTLVFVYPTWWYGMPAALKGWLDRVLLPGVAFSLPSEGDIRPELQHVTRLGVFTTCGASWRLTRFVGAPGKRTLMLGLGLLCAPWLKRFYCAHYSMDASTPESRARHLARVERTVARMVRTARARAPVAPPAARRTS